MKNLKRILFSATFGVEEIEEKGGTLEEFELFVEKAKECAAVVNSVAEITNYLSGGKKRLHEKEVPNDKPKKSKTTKSSDVMKEALFKDDGVESKLQREFVGRIDISLDQLEVSSKVYNPQVREAVEGIKESILSRFEPSLLQFTVVPKDLNKFSWKEAENLSYNVVSGRNLLLALKDLDKEGRLTSLKTLKNKKVLCYIIKTNSAIAMNYSNLRLKDIQS